MHARTLSLPRTPPHWRGLADYVREHLNVAARTLREWAHAWQGLRERPLLRAALLEGELSCVVTNRGRLVVGRVTPETEAAFLDSVRGRTARAVEAVVRALRQTEGKQPETRDQEDGERVGMRIRFARREEILCRPRVSRASPVAIAFHAPHEVAAFFRATFGSLAGTMRER